MRMLLEKKKEALLRKCGRFKWVIVIIGIVLGNILTIVVVGCTTWYGISQSEKHYKLIVEEYK